MREDLDASDVEILEALKVNLGVKLSEAKIILDDVKLVLN